MIQLTRQPLLHGIRRAGDCPEARFAIHSFVLARTACLECDLGPRGQLVEVWRQANGRKWLVLQLLASVATLYDPIIRRPPPPFMYRIRESNPRACGPEKQGFALSSLRR